MDGLNPPIAQEPEGLPNDAMMTLSIVFPAGQPRLSDCVKRRSFCECPDGFSLGSSGACLDK